VPPQADPASGAALAIFNTPTGSWGDYITPAAAIRGRYAMKVFKIGPTVLAIVFATALMGCGGAGEPQQSAVLVMQEDKKQRAVSRSGYGLRLR
jgi:hypothetical protein